MKNNNFLGRLMCHFLLLGVVFCSLFYVEMGFSEGSACSFYFKSPLDIAFNAEENMVNYEVRKKIMESVQKGSLPAVIFDIDGTVYTTQNRILSILKKYDRENKTHYFDSATPDHINPDAVFTFIRSAIGKLVFERTKKDKKIEEVIGYLKRERNMDYNFDEDIAFEKVQRVISEYRDLGARIIFISERLDRTKNKTKFLLKRDGIYFDELHFRESGIEPQDFKIDIIHQIMMRQDVDPVAIFDDVFQIHHLIASFRFESVLQILTKTNFQEKSFRFYVPLP